MSNDVLIAIPLFLFMGYLVERAQLIDRLFQSLHLATARVPGSLAVATIVTCAIFATATGIVGAVVTLMGLLAFPAMLKAGYNIKVAAGAVTAGGCLGILIPPSVLLIVYGATAGVSVVQLYAGAFFPGFMLAALYIGYVIVLAKWKPALMPPLAESERRVPLPPFAQALAQRGGNALTGLWRALTGGGGAGVAKRTAARAARRDAAAGARHRRAAGRHLSRGDRAGGRSEHRRPGRGGRGGRGGHQGGIGGSHRPTAAEEEASRSRARAPRRPLRRRRRKDQGGGGDRAGGRGRGSRAGETAAAAPSRAAAGADLVLDRACRRHRRHRAHLLAVELGAARSVQAAAHLVLPAGAADPRGARLDRVRAGDARRGGGGRRVRRLRARRGLPLHRAVACGAAGRRSSPAPCSPAR